MSQHGTKDLRDRVCRVHPDAVLRRERCGFRVVWWTGQTDCMLTVRDAWEAAALILVRCAVRRIVSSAWCMIEGTGATLSYSIQVGFRSGPQTVIVSGAACELDAWDAALTLLQRRSPQDVQALMYSIVKGEA